MRKRKKAVQALEGAAAINEARAIIRKLVEDEDLRANVGRAIESSRRAYDRVSHTKKPAKLLDDKRLHADVTEAYDAARSIAIGLAGVGENLPQLGKPRKRRGLRLGRLLLLGVIGGGAAMALSEGLRSKVLDALFGAEEEFEYSPPPTTSTSTSTETPGSPLSAV